MPDRDVLSLISPTGLAHLIDQVGRASFGLAFSAGLNPAQWGALRYIAKASPEARTVTGFARYQGTTQGTASRTIAALVAKGYVRKDVDGRDSRRARLGLTPSGCSLLDQDPLAELTTAVAALSAAQRLVVAEAMEQMLHQLMSRRTAGSGEAKTTGRPVSPEDA